MKYKIILPKEEHKQGSIVEAVKEVISNQLQQVEELRQETQGYICPQTKKQCDDECCVSAEHCHIEASFGIISDCEQPKQEITIEEIEQQITLTEARGERVIKYLDKYKGQSIYNEIALAIEFGYQLKLEEDE